jgi:hypothetical protein
MPRGQRKPAASPAEVAYANLQATEANVAKLEKQHAEAVELQTTANAAVTRIEGDLETARKIRDYESQHPALEGYEQPGEAYDNLAATGDSELEIVAEPEPEATVTPIKKAAAPRQTAAQKKAAAEAAAAPEPEPALLDPDDPDAWFNSP